MRVDNFYSSAGILMERVKRVMENNYGTAGNMRNADETADDFRWKV